MMQVTAKHPPTIASLCLEVWQDSVAALPVACSEEHQLHNPVHVCSTHVYRIVKLVLILKAAR